MEQFVSYLREAFGERADTILSALENGEEAPSVRINPQKLSLERALEHFGEASPVPWCREGLFLPKRPSYTLDPYLHAGAYYVQDSSSMFVGEVFRSLVERFPEGTTLRVLDLCAAPGGKTTHLSSILRSRFGDNFLLVGNEVMKQRAGVLCDNLSIWGDANVLATSVDPAAFGSLPEFFDVILVDAPCSGEGMFRKDASAREQWGEDVVSLCEKRQRRILLDVLPSLRSGGFLVYSTCTFNRRENEGNVAFLCDNGMSPVAKDDFPDNPLWESSGVVSSDMGWRLAPGLVPGEGQFCCALRKDGDDSAAPAPYTPYAPYTSGKSTSRRPSRPNPRGNEIPSFVRSLLEGDWTYTTKGDTIIAVPSHLEPLCSRLSALRPLRSGIAVGVVKGKDLVPFGDLATSMSLRKDAFPVVEVDRTTALRFLHKDPVVLSEAPRGLVLLRFEGLSLGFVKNLGNRTNNLLEKDRRIRMDVE